MDAQPGPDPGAAANLRVQRVRLAYQQVADQLRERILERQLVAGDRLPPEAALCEHFGVSRSSLREALRLLTSEGLVTTTRGAGGGTSVAVPHPDSVVHYLTGTFSLLAGAKQVSVTDLLQARELLEVPAARMAASHRSQATLELMRASIPDPVTDPERAKQFEVNRGFHELVLAAAPNPLLRVMTQPVFATLHNRFLRDRATPGFWQEVVADHEHIFQAIEARDPEAAGSRMAVHLHKLRGTYEMIDAAKSQEIAS